MPIQGRVETGREVPAASTGQRGDGGLAGDEPESHTGGREEVDWELQVPLLLPCITIEDWMTLVLERSKFHV